MKKTLLFCALLFAFSASSITIPKKVIGQYDAEVPDFEFEENGQTKKAAGFLLSIKLRETNLLYRMGTMEYSGTYTEVLQKGGFVDIKVNVTNNNSLEFDLDLKWDKKTKTLSVKGIKGIEEVICSKVDDMAEKNKGFKRL